MKFYLFSFLIIIALFACKEEPPIDLCKNVVCNNGGICNSGLCDCPSEFMGIACDSLAPASAIRISKIFITDFLERETFQHWDSSTDRPDIFIRLTGNGVSPAFNTEIQQNANFEEEYEFDVDWRIDHPETGAYSVTFDLFDDDTEDDGISDYMGNQVFFISNYRNEKPSTIIFPFVEDVNNLGIKIELEWIFE